MKIIPFSVSEVAKSFHLEEQKLKIDYMKERKKGHMLTSEEVSYIKNDVVIMAKALKQIFEAGLTRMTSASNALFDYKKILGGQSKFEHYFPILSYECDKDIRQSYKRRIYLSQSKVRRSRRSAVGLY